MPYDLIVILAGGMRNDGSLPQNVKYRIEMAKELFDQGLAPRVLMSGRWSAYWEKRLPPHTEAEAMKRYAQELGIPANTILKEEYSSTTIKNAFFTTKHFLRPNRWKKIIVVTSDFHVPRTKYIFETILGSEYQVAYHGAKTDFMAHQWLLWQIKERIFCVLTSKQQLLQSLQKIH